MGQEAAMTQTKQTSVWFEEKYSKAISERSSTLYRPLKLQWSDIWKSILYIITINIHHQNEIFLQCGLPHFPTLQSFVFFDEPILLYIHFLLHGITTSATDSHKLCLWLLLPYMIRPSSHSLPKTNIVQWHWTDMFFRNEDRIRNETGTISL